MAAACCTAPLQATLPSAGVALQERLTRSAPSALQLRISALPAIRPIGRHSTLRASLQDAASFPASVLALNALTVTPPAERSVAAKAVAESAPAEAASAEPAVDEEKLAKLKLQSELDLKLQKKLLARRKKLVRKRRLRKQGKWPPSKVQAGKKV